MCGICGIYQFKNSDAKELNETVNRMNDFQKRRGPDDGGIFVDEKNGVVLGHRRLSILDVSTAGHQPMRFAQLITDNQKLITKKEYWITFNGEIYNFRELRKDMEDKGYEFNTNTDTEVILALYAEYGEKSFLMLRGMFSFGLWDDNKRKLLLVRDRYGIKPLYYTRSDNKVVFGSTVRAVKESGAGNFTENKDAKILFLIFGSIPGPYTTWSEILSVKPGYFLEISGNGKIEEKKYYDSFLPFLEKCSDSYKIAVKKIRELLDESVKLHLISDAPLGVFLSGGLDSSAIAAVATIVAEQRGFEHGKTRKNENLKTISIIFNENEFSEKKYQQEVVEKIKSDHKEVKVTKENFEKSFDDIFEAMDQPTIDGVNTYFVSQVAKQSRLKVVLSGLGSDEIFMGYHYFKTSIFIRWAQKIIPGFLFLLLPKKGRWGRLQWLKKKHPFYSYVSLRGIFSPAEVAEILKIDEDKIWGAVKKVMEILPKEKELEKLSEPDLQSYFDLSFYMMNQLLKDADFMSMTHSLEIRVPFLDHILVEYLSSLPSNLKLTGKYPKQLLIDAVSDLLPSSIWDRPKMGFTFPFEKWFKESSLAVSHQAPVINQHWSKHWANIVLRQFLA